MNESNGRHVAETGDISADELRAQARHVMRPFLDRISKKAEIAGIVLLSTSADTPQTRSRFAQSSDFDVSIFIFTGYSESDWHSQNYETYSRVRPKVPAWLPNFLFYVPVPWGSMEVNVHQLLLQYEEDPRTVWDDDKIDAYRNKSEILLDPTGRVHSLIRSKTELATEGRRLREEARLQNRLTWDSWELPLKQAKRLGPVAGHHVMNHALEELLDYLYVRSSLPVPNKKWKLDLLEYRHLTGAAENRLIEEVLQCNPRSHEDLDRRIEAMKVLIDRVSAFDRDESSVGEIRRRFERYIEIGSPIADVISLRYGNGSNRNIIRNMVNYMLPSSEDEFFSNLPDDIEFDSWKDEYLAARAVWLVNSGEGQEK